MLERVSMKISDTPPFLKQTHLFLPTPPFLWGKSEFPLNSHLKTQSHPFKKGGWGSSKYALAFTSKESNFH